MKHTVSILLAGLLLISAGAGAAEPSLWRERAAQEKRWRAEGLALIPHQPNYFFPFTYNTSPHTTTNNSAQYKEAKFQLSVKVLLVDKFFQDYAHLYFGYTQLSLWQVYDQNRSAPFRDTNHEPEIIVSLDTDRSLKTLTLRQTDIGVVHQSNGTTRPDSRSWNRVYAKFHIDHRDLALTVKPWIRIPDSNARDDNKDIMKFMGYGEVVVSYASKNHVLSGMFRNNMRADKNRGALRIEYSFPLTRNLTGLAQFFTGYGETLLDYNRPSNRFSVGLALSEWH